MKLTIEKPKFTPTEIKLQFETSKEIEAFAHIIMHEITVSTAIANVSPTTNRYDIKLLLHQMCYQFNTQKVNQP